MSAIDWIEREVTKTPGTWVKRRNLRRKLIAKHNDAIMALISEAERDIRLKKAKGLKDGQIRSEFHKLSELKREII